MPIVYETPGPVAQAGIVAQQAQAAANRRASYDYGGGGGGGGGRGGYGSAVPYDTGIQDAIQARDSMQFAQAKAAQDNARAYGLQQMQGDQQIATDTNRFQLQAQLHDVELSQQERMRLQRLKNSIGEITSDPALTDEEKSDMISQVKYGIDPLQRRLTQEKLAQEKIVNESLVENRQAQTALHGNRLKYFAQTFDDHKVYHVDDSVLSQIVADFTEGLGPAAKLVPASTIAQMAKQEAIKQGLGVTLFQQPDGKWEQMGGKGGKGKGGADGEDDHPSGFDKAGYLKKRAEVEKQVTADAKERVEDGLGNKKPVYEWIQAPEGREQEVQNRLKKMDLPGTLDEYKGQAEQSKGKYKNPFAPKAAAAATPQAKDDAAFSAAKLDKQANELALAGNLSDDEKQAGQYTLLQIKQLAASAATLKGEEKAAAEKQLLVLGQNYQKLKDKMKAPAAGPAPTGLEPGAPGFQPRDGSAPVQPQYPPGAWWAPGAPGFQQK